MTFFRIKSSEQESRLKPPVVAFVIFCKPEKLAVAAPPVVANLKVTLAVFPTGSVTLKTSSLKSNIDSDETTGTVLKLTEAAPAPVLSELHSQRSLVSFHLRI